MISIMHVKFRIVNEYDQDFKYGLQIYNICHWSLIFAHDPISKVLYLYLDFFYNAITLLSYIEYLVFCRLFLKRNGSNGDPLLPNCTNVWFSRT